MIVNYAHRGASEYAPENTMSAFYLGLMQGANGIETDVQKTKDGVLVLFHDDTVDRVTDGTGSVAQFTWEELQQRRVYGNSTTGFYDRVVTLDAFLEAFSQYDIFLALELKGPGVEEQTLEKVKEYGILDRVTFTSFQFAYIRKIKELDKNARVGWLVSQAGEAEISALKEIGGEEMAPKASDITPELVAKLREQGMGIRAWGVSSVAIMKQMCQLGIDGMTVNFPDRLYQYWNTRNGL